VPASPPKIAARTKLLQYSPNTAIDISENAQRDASLLTEWAASCGIQMSDGFRLASEGGVDVYAITDQYLPDNSPILYVPNELMLTGSKAREELGNDARGAEQMVVNSEASNRLSQFYLFLKVLKEYELGQDSFTYYWMNSLPRYFSNGASLTDFCFGCLPPYAAEASLAEKYKLKLFVQALSQVPFLSTESKNNEDLAKWAFSVVHTRYFPMADGDCCIVPTADFFNHGSEPNAYITYDDEGNCYAFTTREVQAGQPLMISYGDSTNPSALLAKYGFLDESAPATFCKYVVNNPSAELVNMGYDPSRMLFYTNGEIAQEVWDVLLYEALGKVSYDEQQSLYQAHMTGNVELTLQYHQQYFEQTKSALQEHVNFLLNELEELGLGLEIQVSQGQDAERHPRLPLIMRHNEFITKILENVQQNLDSMV